MTIMDRTVLRSTVIWPLVIWPTIFWPSVIWPCVIWPYCNFAIGLLTKQGITLVCISLSLKKSQVFYKIFAHHFDKFYVYKYTCFGKVLSRLYIITKRTKTKEQRTIDNICLIQIFAKIHLCILQIYGSKIISWQIFLQIYLYVQCKSMSKRFHPRSAPNVN